MDAARPSYVIISAKKLISALVAAVVVKIHLPPLSMVARFVKRYTLINSYHRASDRRVLRLIATCQVHIPLAEGCGNGFVSLMTKTLMGMLLTLVHSMTTFSALPQVKKSVDWYLVLP